MERGWGVFFFLNALFIGSMLAGFFFGGFVHRPEVLLLFSVLLLVGVTYSSLDPLVGKESDEPEFSWLARFLFFDVSVMVFLLFLVLNNGIPGVLYDLVKQGWSRVYELSMSHDGSWVLNGNPEDPNAVPLNWFATSSITKGFVYLSILGSISIAFFAQNIFIQKKREKFKKIIKKTINILLSKKEGLLEGLRLGLISSVILLTLSEMLISEKYGLIPALINGTYIWAIFLYGAFMNILSLSYVNIEYGYHHNQNEKIGGRLLGFLFFKSLVWLFFGLFFWTSLGTVCGFLAGTFYFLFDIFVFWKSMNSDKKFSLVSGVFLGILLGPLLGVLLGQDFGLGKSLLFNGFYYQFLLFAFVIKPFFFLVFISPLLYPFVLAIEITNTETGRNHAWWFHGLAFVFASFPYFVFFGHSFSVMLFAFILFVSLLVFWLALSLLSRNIIFEALSSFSFFTIVFSFSSGVFLTVLRETSSPFFKLFSMLNGSYALLVFPFVLWSAISSLFSKLNTLNTISSGSNIVSNKEGQVLSGSQKKGMHKGSGLRGIIVGMGGVVVWVFKGPFILVKKFFKGVAVVGRAVFLGPFVFLRNGVIVAQNRLSEGRERKRLVRKRVAELLEQSGLPSGFEASLVSFLNKHPRFLEETPSAQDLYLSRLSGGQSLLGKYLQQMLSSEPLIDLRLVASDLGLDERAVLVEVRRLLDAGLLEGSLFSHVFVKVREEQLMGVLKEASDLFERLRERVSGSGVFSRDDAVLSQELLLRLKTLLEVSKELKISILEEHTRQKIKQLQELITKYHETS